MGIFAALLVKRVKKQFKNTLKIKADSYAELKIPHLSQPYYWYNLFHLFYNKAINFISRFFLEIFFILLNMWKGNLFLAKFFGKNFFIL